MRSIVDLSNEDALVHFLKSTSYFKSNLPEYIDFEPLLMKVAEVLAGKTYHEFKKKDPDNFADVNYRFSTNKDGRFAWRPFELIHPALYVSLVNVICFEDNWSKLVERLRSLHTGAVECCGLPVVSEDCQTDRATQA